ADETSWYPPRILNWLEFLDLNDPFGSPLVDRLTATWGEKIGPQEASADFLALDFGDCQQSSSGGYNLDKATENMVV
ncbi:MAG TPA: hypothetical protein VMV19_01855, partial [Xanthobacteraceae bacterium]|nr:hypothetical protein [Xanthobacteraceae bacterium]